MDEIPLGHINYADFFELVVRQDVRPERPDDEEVLQLSDAVWELAERCWVKDPKLRPTASAVCDTLSHLLDTATTARQIPNPSSHPPHVPVQARGTVERGAYTGIPSVKDNACLRTGAASTKV